MKVITIQPASFTDNVWGTEDGKIVEGRKTPYPFSIDAETGDVLDQEFWRGDPFRVLGFQAYVDRQKVDLWWKDAVHVPDAIVGMFPVMLEQDKGPYTYTLAIESVEVHEVSA